MQSEGRRRRVRLQHLSRPARPVPHPPPARPALHSRPARPRRSPKQVRRRAPRAMLDGFLTHRPLFRCHALSKIPVPRHRQQALVCLSVRRPSATDLFWNQIPMPVQLVARRESRPPQAGATEEVRPSAEPGPPAAREEELGVRISRPIGHAPYQPGVRISRPEGRRSRNPMGVRISRPGGEGWSWSLERGGRAPTRMGARIQSHSGRRRRCRGIPFSVPFQVAHSKNRNQDQPRCQADGRWA